MKAMITHCSCRSINGDGEKEEGTAGASGGGGGGREGKLRGNHTLRTCVSDGVQALCEDTGDAMTVTMKRDGRCLVMICAYVILCDGLCVWGGGVCVWGGEDYIGRF